MASIKSKSVLFDSQTLFYAGHEFRGMPFNITVAYETVPKVGAMWRRSFTFGGHQMPADYFMSNAVPRSGWVH